MKRAFVAILVVSVLTLAFPQTAVARDGSEDNDDDLTHFGPYTGASPDSGTCGNDWAQDTFRRHFTVTPVAGSWYVREDYRDGKFTTIAGASPGACETDSPHGSVVAAGITGEFKGWLAGTVTGGTFDPNASCPDPCNGTGFVAAFFGATAVWNVSTFRFSYHAEGEHLAYRRWQNASTDQGGNRGDIANR